jgi:hypothetical protein
VIIYWSATFPLVFNHTISLCIPTIFIQSARHIWSHWTGGCHLKGFYFCVWPFWNLRHLSKLDRDTHDQRKTKWCLVLEQARLAKAILSREMVAELASEGTFAATRLFRNGKSIQLEGLFTSWTLITKEKNSRNCTKHSCRCDYMDTHSTRENSNPIPPITAPPLSLMVTPEIDVEIEHWRTSGIPPWPELSICPRDEWLRFPKSTLRLIYHISALSIDLNRRGLGEATVWSTHISRLVESFNSLSLWLVDTGAYNEYCRISCTDCWPLRLQASSSW